jgi:para-aminobenzoate synthetase component I
MATASCAVRDLSREIDPLEIFRNVAREPHPVLLLSGRKDPEKGSRSLVAWDPFLILTCKGGRARLKSLRYEREEEGDPFEVLREILERYRVERDPEIPFAGGAVGYLGYGLRRYAGASSRHPVSASPWPDLQLAFYDRACVIDHDRRRVRLIATGLPEEGAARREEKRRLDLTRMAERLAAPAAREPHSPPAPIRGPVYATSRDEHRDRIRRAQEYLTAGDIYQVNLSHRIRMEGSWTPFTLFREVAAGHPACFSAYLPYSDHTVICASPERLVRRRGDRVETRPIKGTRARAADPSEDRSAAETLAAGAKERSENVMIVDLARNDLGRVCVPGTVEVEKLCQVETLPTVHHLVSTVVGRLRRECDGVDLVRALFPGGSMTGAPKIRAMEIIDELEGEDRGIYSGSVGYFSFDGDLDLNIVIRTLVVSSRTAELQVGGAILAESDPDAEYQETLDKALPLLRLLEGKRPGEGEGGGRGRA